MAKKRTVKKKGATKKKTTKMKAAKQKMPNAPATIAVAKMDSASCSIGPCYCSAILSLLIIVFVWLSRARVTWTVWAVTIAAIVLLILSLTGGCCCKK